MLVPLSWLAEYVSLPDGVTTDQLDAAFVRMAYEVDGVTDLRTTVSGPLVVGRVLEVDELTEFKKPIRYCRLDVGEGDPRGVICGATNFSVGDLVVVALPGAVLPGDFTITARKTYGHVSDGMICSERELGLGDDHAGIMVLPSDLDATPGQDARSAAGLDDVVFDLNVNPDRGYALSVRGLARDLALAFGVPFRDPAGVPVSGTPGSTAYPVRVEDRSRCDRFTARAVRGIDPAAPSPAWLRRRLTHAGMRPISLSVDITNYLMLELGQPMHAFDLGRLAGELVVRRARDGERLTTLDGVERALDPDDLVICDDTGPISLAAVMGGLSTEVNVATTDVLFEAAHWDPAAVARTSRRHKLSSEAGRRWERGVDHALPPVALTRAAELLTRYAGGTAEDAVLDLDYRAAPAPVRVERGLAMRVTGVTGHDPQDEERAYRAVGCEVAGDGQAYLVTPPTWRPDLTDPYDLVEEFARFVGYDEVPSALPPAAPGRGLTASQRRRRSIGRALAEAGFVEVLCYPFVSPSVHDDLGLSSDDPRRIACRVANPLSDEAPELRTTLLGPLLATVRRNLGRGHRDLAVYEVGLVFRPEGAEPGRAPVLPVDHRPGDAELEAAERHVPRQPWHVAAVLVGDAELPGWWGAGRQADWSDAVGAAQVVATTAGVELVASASNLPPWHPGRCAALRLPDGAGGTAAGGTLVGHAGELHPAVCDALELPRRTCAMELDLDALPLAGPAQAPQVSGFPPALLDVALLVTDEVPAAEVQRALTDGAGDLLESIRLFDVFTGERLGEGRKSLAYKLSFRAADRTLTLEEAVAARDSAVAEAARRVGAELRGGTG